MPDGDTLAATAAAREGDVRLALACLFMAVSEGIMGGLSCAEVVDEATRRASTAERAVTTAAGLDDPVARRFGAARVLNTMCGACRECPRGALGKTAASIIVPSLPADRG